MVINSYCSVQAVEAVNSEYTSCGRRFCLLYCTDISSNESASESASSGGKRECRS